MSCSFPYTNPPACNTTLAEEYHLFYLIYQSAFSVVVAVLSLLVVLQTAILFRRPTPLAAPPSAAHSNNKSVQRTVIVLLCIECSLFLMRAVDPLGWRAILPSIVITITGDAGSCTLMSSLITICFFWVEVIDQARAQTNLNDDQSDVASCCPSLRTILHLLTWICTLSLSVVQEQIGPLWLYRSIKCYVLAFILLLVAITFFRYGYIIYTSLQQASSQLISSRSSSPITTAADFDIIDHVEAPPRSSVDSPRAPASVGTPVGTPKPNTNYSSNTMVSTILRVMILGAVGILLSIACLCTIASTVLVSRVTDRSYEMNETLFSRIMDCTSDIVQVLATSFLCFFFRRAAAPQRSDSLTAQPAPAVAGTTSIYIQRSNGSSMDSQGDSRGSTPQDRLLATPLMYEGSYGASNRNSILSVGTPGGGSVYGFGSSFAEPDRLSFAQVLLPDEDVLSSHARQQQIFYQSPIMSPSRSQQRRARNAQDEQQQPTPRRTSGPVNNAAQRQPMPRTPQQPVPPPSNLGGILFPQFSGAASSPSFQSPVRRMSGTDSAASMAEAFPAQRAGVSQDTTSFDDSDPFLSPFRAPVGDRSFGTPTQQPSFGGFR